MSPSPASYVPIDKGTTTSSPEAEEVSVSTIAATATTGHLMFKIEGYSKLKELHDENGSYVESSASKQVGGHAWRIRCHLNGDSNENAGFVSLYLILCNYATGPAVRAELMLALVPHQGTSPPYGLQDGTPSKRSLGMRTFGGKDNHCGWGFKKFISVEELERSMFLEDDCLAVQCTVTVVGEQTVFEKAVQVHDLARLGMLCKCDDDLCKRHHDRPAPVVPETFLETFAKFFYSVCRGPGR